MLRETKGVSDTEIISLEPATSAEVWRGPIGDLEATVAGARRGWPAWPAQPLAIGNGGGPIRRMVRLRPDGPE